MPSRNAAPCLIVVFDITAALEQMTSLPTLAGLFAKKKLHDETQVLGLSHGQNRELIDLRALVRATLTRADLPAHGVEQLVERLHLERLYGQDATGYEILVDNIKGFERAYDLPGDRLLDLLCVPSQASTILDMALCAGIDRSRGRLRAIVQDVEATPQRLSLRPRLHRQLLIPVERDRHGEPLWTYLSRAIVDFVKSRCD